MKPIIDARKPMFRFSKAVRHNPDIDAWRSGNPPELFALADPKGLLEGTGTNMRHVKLRPGEAVDARALAALIKR